LKDIVDSLATDRLGGTRVLVQVFWMLSLRWLVSRDRTKTTGIVCAWMAARNVYEAYGELVLFRFPTGRHLDGPNQVEARIDNDALISEQFALWGRVRSEVFRGILLVIPLGDHLLYAEPVFLKPEAIDFLELRRIILADSSQIAMHRALDDSI
jgi:uncharacterized membrane protein (UPF0182 family)